MSGFWEYGGYGHSGFFNHKAADLIDIFMHRPDVIEEGPGAFIAWAWTEFRAVSVWSCQGHPDEGNYKGYITWIFETAESHMRFMLFMNELQEWMHNQKTKSVTALALEANPLYHPTTEYDRMAVPALTMRTMPFHNNRIRSQWWANLVETASRLKEVKRHQVKLPNKEGAI